MEVHHFPAAPEVPAEVLHDLFSRLTHEINLLALLLTGTVNIDAINPRIAQEIERLGNEWKAWIVDESTRCSIFEAYVWFEVSQYLGKLHRDIWGGKMGGAFKDMCKQMQTTLLQDADIETVQSFALWRAQGAHMVNLARDNNIIEWGNIDSLVQELFAILKIYLPVTEDIDEMVTNRSTLHYRLVKTFSLAARVDNLMMRSTVPMLVIYGRPRRFDADKMWPSNHGIAGPDTVIKFQISPSIKMQVPADAEADADGRVATIFITKCKVCV
ncbi:hypothetical protein ACHAQA_009738 [Verticillium albo-atrum]